MSKIATPENIQEYSEEELLELVYKLSDNRRVKPASFIKLVGTYFSAINQRCGNDIKLAVATQTNHKLIDAQAGGGKTNLASQWIIFQKKMYASEHGKMLQAMNILCLVYNKHNPRIMQRKHELLVSALIHKGVINKNPNISNMSPTILASTMHSFALDYIEDRFYLIGEDKLYLDTTCESIILPEIVRKELGDEFIKNDFKLKNFSALHELYYNYVIFDYEDTIEEVDKILEQDKCTDLLDKLEITAEQFIEIKNKYKKFRIKFLKKMTYVDSLVFLYKLLKNNDFLRVALREKYKYCVVDEVQDFTPLMFKILQLLCSDDTKLLCIGDADQSIYGYRGACIDIVNNFNNYFPKGKIFQLLTNFRCSKQVLESADIIIRKIKNRVPKILTSIHDDGKVNLLSYSTRTNCNDKVINIIRDAGHESIAVLMREKIYFSTLSFKLYQNNINYYLYNATPFYKHTGFIAFKSIISLLKVTDDRRTWLDLYKILPLKKDDWFTFIGYNYKTRKVENFKDVRHWYNIDITLFSKSISLAKRWNNLKKIATNLDTQTTNQYMSYLKKAFLNDYWDSRILYEKNLYIQLTKDEVADWIEEIYSQPLYLVQVIKNLNDYEEKIKGNNETNCNLGLGVFHSVKGLEYKNVIMPYLDDKFFPDIANIVNRDYTEKYKDELIAEEYRIAYVGMTRAINNLYMIYNEINPSRIIIDLEEHQKKTNIKEELPFSIRTKFK